MMRRLLFFCILLCGAGKACAQASPTATGPGTLVKIGGGFSGFQADYGDRILGGGVVWIDANPIWRIGVEGEARWLRFNSDTQTKEATYLVGPKVTVLSRGRYEPYVKALAGGSQFTFPFNSATGTYFVIAGGAGVDVNVSRHWEVRAIDFEYQRWPKFSFGALSPYGISAGVSYRLFRSRSNLGR